MRYLRAVASAGVLILSLAGIPLVLAATIGDPRPGWVAVEAGDVSDTALVDVLVTLAWLSWAYFAATVLVEAVHLIGARHGRWTPEAWPGPGRQLARTLLTAAVVALPVSTSAQAFASGSAVPATVAVATAGYSAGLSPGTVRAELSSVSPTTSAPAPAKDVVSPAVQSGPLREYVIERHGPATFWELAQIHLGDGQRWRQLWALNEGRIEPDGTRLRTPGLLQVGWTIRLPAAPASPVAGDRAMFAAAVTADPKDGPNLTYHVREGDRLGSIAVRFLGDFGRYREIRNANADLMPTPTGAHGADHIQTGWRLVLPAGAHDRGPIPHATGPTHDAPATQPSGHGPGSSPSPSPKSPSPQPAQAEPAPRPAPSPGGSSAQSGSSPHRDSSPPGISLPGGWMDLPLAVAVVAAAAAIWVRRRMTYLYKPFEDEDDEENPDGDLQALPAVVTRLRRAVREHAAALPEAFPAPRNPPSGNPALPVSAPVTTGIGTLTPLIPPPEGLGLIGAGASAALRALLVSVLSVPASHRHRDVIITSTLLKVLLPGLPATGAGFPSLVVAEPGQVLALLENNDSSHLPVPLLLIGEVPPPRAHSRLVQALRGGDDRSVLAVLLGEWAPGATITVETTGEITDPSLDEYPRRLAVLNEGTTLSLLQVLREASPSPHPNRTGAAQELTGDDEPRPPETGSNVPSEREAVSVGGRHVETPGIDAVRISVLGTPAIHRQDGSPVSGLRRHASELLVYLAVHREGARLSEIMEALWPDATMRRAQQRLSTEVASLRRAIRTAAADPHVQPVVNTGGHYHLDPHAVDIDLWRLLDHLNPPAGSGPQRPRAGFEGPWGVLAEGCDYDWIEGPREHVRRQSVRVLLSRAEQPDADPHTAVTLITRAADLDPASEDLAQRTMRALAAVGDAPAIPERLTRLSNVLAGIGEQPSPATIALASDLTASLRTPR